MYKDKDKYKYKDNYKDKDKDEDEDEDEESILRRHSDIRTYHIPVSIWSDNKVHTLLVQ